MTWRNHYQCWQAIGPSQSRQSSSYKKPGRRVVSALSRVPCSSIQVVLISRSSRKASWRHDCSACWRCFGPDTLSSSSHLKLDVSCSSLFSYSFVFLCLFLRVTGQYQSSLFVDGPGSALENQLMSLNFLFCFSPPFFFSRWLGMASLGSHSSGDRSACSGVPGLSVQQLEVCKAKPDLIPSVSRGANVAITECQRQFRNERWNCSITNSSSVFGGVLSVGKCFSWQLSFIILNLRCFSRITAALSASASL